MIGIREEEPFQFYHTGVDVFYCYSIVGVDFSKIHSLSFNKLCNRNSFLIDNKVFPFLVFI